MRSYYILSAYKNPHLLFNGSLNNKLSRKQERSAITCRSFISSPSRARTYNNSVNSRVLYHWAIEEYLRFSMYLENHIYYYTSKLLLRQYLTVNFLMEVLLRFAQKNDLPTKTRPAFGFASIVLVKFTGQTLDRLVLVSSMHYCTSTPSLSTSSSSRGLTSLKEWDISSWGGLHA